MYITLYDLASYIIMHIRYTLMNLFYTSTRVETGSAYLGYFFSSSWVKQMKLSQTGF